MSMNKEEKKILKDAEDEALNARKSMKEQKERAEKAERDNKEKLHDNKELNNTVTN